MSITERELETVFLSVASSIARQIEVRSRTQFVPEIRTLQGRPDFVAFADAVTLRPDVRSRFAQAFLNQRCAALASAMADEKRYSAESLNASLGWSARNFRETVHILNRHGVIRRYANGDIERSRRFGAFCVPLVAFELKTAITRRAFFQAQQYRRFAHSSYVVAAELDRSKIAFSELQTSIGLVRLTPSAEFTIVRRATRLKPQDPVAYLYALSNAYLSRSGQHGGSFGSRERSRRTR